MDLNVLTPITLTGTVIPWVKVLSGGRESEFKLVCSDGSEYFFVADFEWKDILSDYVWKEVKVIGLLNFTTNNLIPQKVFPKGPLAAVEDVFGLVKKLVHKVNDVVVVPEITSDLATA